MSRVREVKQADVDRLIQVYNRMVDALRGERVQLQEQQHFLARVLRESPGGIVVLDFDGRVSLANPAAERLLQAPGETLTGAELAALDRVLARDLVALAPGERRVLAVWGGRRVRALHGTFLDRGFRRSFYLLEELTEELRHSEKAAYEKLIRMLSHEVNNTVGASNSLLNSCLTYGVQLHPHDRDGLRTRARRGHRTHRAAERVHGQFRRRRATARPAAGTGRSGRRRGRVAGADSRAG